MKLLADATKLQLEQINAMVAFIYDGLTSEDKARKAAQEAIARGATWRMIGEATGVTARVLGPATGPTVRSGASLPTNTSRGAM